MATTPAVLFVGTQGVGKSTIASRLLTTDGQQQQQQLPATWCIDNKYYTAEVLLQKVDVPGPSASDHAASSKEQQVQQQGDSEAHERAEGVVLVVDTSDERSFHAVHTWAQGPGEGVLEGAEVRLLLANKADLMLQLKQRQRQGQEQEGGEPVLPSGEVGASSERPEWLLGAMDWCAENGVEYIEVCGRYEGVDAGLELEGEVQGMARVVEALHAHMWPGMQLKERGAQGQAAGRGEGRGVAQPQGDAPGTAGQRQEAAVGQGVGPGGEEGVPAGAATAATAAGVPAGANGAAPRNGKHAGSQAASGSAAGAAAAAGAAVGAATGSALGAGLDLVTSGVAVDSDEDDPEAQEVEAFDKMFTELQGARERLAGLPDEQRRAQAADIALRLASMLGLDSEEDEDDD